MKIMKPLAYILIILSLSLSCSPAVINTRSNYPVNTLSSSLPNEENKYLKVHFKDGQLAVIYKWQINNETKKISGKGQRYNSNRNLTRADEVFDIDFDECVLLETNDFEGFNVISPLLMTVTIFTSVITVPCIFNPKSCFGSCPTFYLSQDDSLIIQAEGFSSSITKSMEAADIDYLPSYQSNDSRIVNLELKNEALETHYIRRANLLAVPKPESGLVYHDENKFYTASNFKYPIKVNGGDTETLNLLSYKDRNEYLSISDSADLSSQESIIIDFDTIMAEDAGIVITQRQSLMTTFLFYQSMAYMGRQYGELAAAYERSSKLVRGAQKTMYDVLGGVEVSIEISGKWKKIGVVKEQGPIVSDTHLLPFDFKGEFSRVKLTLTKGLWQIDQVGICSIKEVESPEIIQPYMLVNNGQEDLSMLSILNDDESMLVNNPGVSYTLSYQLPDQREFALFLDTQGYYTEWMRSEWLAEEDLAMVNLILRRPNKWLKLMAPKYKKVEAEMNDLFWMSKFGKIE